MRTVEPKPTMPPSPPEESSTTTASAIFSRSRAILVSRWACSFLASWYSLFSLRSPHSRAVLIRSAISRRPSPSRAASSALRASSPSAVMRLVASGTEPRAYWLGPGGPVRLEVGRRRGRQQCVDLHDGGLDEQLPGGRGAGDEQVFRQAVVLPLVVDVGLGDPGTGRIAGDGVQVEQVAEVDRDEEGDLGAEPFGAEVDERRGCGLTGLIEVGAVAGRLVEQRPRPDHHALGVAPEAG